MPSTAISLSTNHIVLHFPFDIVSPPGLDHRTNADPCVQFDVIMPPPLSVVPAPILALAGGLIARLVTDALLPSFLKLLATDYIRCAPSPLLA